MSLEDYDRQIHGPQNIGYEPPTDVPRWHCGWCGATSTREIPSLVLDCPAVNGGNHGWQSVPPAPRAEVIAWLVAERATDAHGPEVGPPPHGGIQCTYCCDPWPCPYERLRRVRKVCDEYEWQKGGKWLREAVLSALGGSA